MTPHRQSDWTTRITLSGPESVRLKQFINQEMLYYNALVTGMGGPIRTMPNTFKAIVGRLEDLYGLVAATGVDLRRMTPQTLPEPFKPYEDLIFSNGRLALDMRVMLLFDLAVQPAAIHADVRRSLALAMLRHARDQSLAFNNPLTDSEQTYKFAMETVTPLESRNKRHIQLPRSAVTVATEDKRTKITIPYLAAPLDIPTPQRPWSYLIIKDEEDPAHPGQWTMEMCQENNGYMLKKTDSARYEKRRSGRRPPQTERGHSRIGLGSKY